VQQFGVSTLAPKILLWQWMEMMLMSTLNYHSLLENPIGFDLQVQENIIIYVGFRKLLENERHGSEPLPKLRQ
jgi:hypothetical protein